MPPSKETALYNVIGQLINPALREIQDFSREKRTRKTCRDLYGMSYQSIYYFLNKLNRRGKILPLICESGYKKRYCIDTDVKRHKRRLRSCIGFLKTKNHKYIYRIGTKDFALDFEVELHQSEFRDENTLIALYDKELLRYYVVQNSVFLAVIRWEDKTNPRLPGSTYGYGTEYSRCLTLFKKQKLSHRTLSLVGHRTVTGRRLA